MPVQRVLDSTIRYQEVGGGTPVVFLHGNPTSSHLWRDVVPAVPGRRLAPDLIGMGGSGKPAIDYSFADHARYLDAWFDALDLDGVVLVGHDWGGALAFDWAARHPERVRGIAFTETIVKPMTWEEFPEAGRALFEAIKSDRGEAMILDDNAFIEMLPGSVATSIGEEDIAAYRAPYPTRQSRRPILRWARSMPLGGAPADVVSRIEAYGAWLAASPDVPKLLVTFAPGPGVMMTPEMIDWCSTHMAGLEIERYDAVAGHHTPEDRPELIATTVGNWLRRNRI
ncbi:haloalkane dehalogenase [Actinoallomurus oryzae]|uniref:Haloalkane dehalogenase n=1 Tax=Actinoallomurus oryzae TaxID=502180 RepID=A0ABP8P9H9_9ACTN